MRAWIEVLLISAPGLWAIYTVFKNNKDYNDILKG